MKLNLKLHYKIIYDTGVISNEKLILLQFKKGCLTFDDIFCISNLNQMNVRVEIVDANLKTAFSC